MIEIFCATLAFIGIIALLGTCLLLFYAGSQLASAITLHSETLRVVGQLHDKILAEHTQIQEWIIQMNTTVENSDTKSAGVREFCARNFLELDTRIKAIEKTFQELNANTPSLLN